MNMVKRLPFEDMAAIDARFWAQVEAERQARQHFQREMRPKLSYNATNYQSPKRIAAMKEPTKAKISDIKVSYTKFENGKTVAYPATSGPAAEPSLNTKLVKQARHGVAFTAADPVRFVASGEGVQQVNALAGPSDYLMTVGNSNVDGVVVLSPAASHTITGTADLVVCEIQDAKCDKFQVFSGPVAVSGAAFIHYVVGPRQSKTIENSDGSTFFVDAGETAIVGFAA